MKTKVYPYAATAVLLAAALVLAVPRGGSSTTLLKLDLERMSREAAMVVQGHVAWDYATLPDADGPTYTLTGIEVTRCVAGECPETVVLRHRGGRAGGVDLRIPGMPRFEPGQEVLLFLEGDYEGRSGTYAVLGMAQGHFLVVEEPASGQKLAVQQLGGVTLASEDQVGNIEPAGPNAPIVEELEGLVERIRELRSKEGGGQ